ncbi:MAG: DUF5798 family protein [Haloquadratum sp.]
MSHDPDADRTISVSDGEVAVEKSFAGEEFPVPAIKFRLDSASDEPVHVRLIDQIPEDFPMEGVGFHPDYESENWTAYKDHRVEYERTLEPGETTTTVYGIRLDDPSDAEGFLGEPILERPPIPEGPQEEPAGSEVEDILGADRSQLVRDALQGDGRLANENAPDVETDPGARDVEQDLDASEPADAEPAGAGAGDGSSGASDPLAEHEDAVADALGPSDDVDEVLDEALGGDSATETAADAGSDDVAADAAAESEEPGAEPTASEEQADEAAAVEAPGADEAVPREVDSDLPTAIERSDADGIDRVGGAASGDDASAADEPAAADSAESEAADEYVDIGEQADESVDASDVAVADPTEEAAAETGGSTADSNGASAAQSAESGGLAATLAEEIRAGEVSESDLDTLRDELDTGLPRSADVRIRRVQAQMEELNAYADAIAEFIDEEGTGAELVERLDTELTEIEEAIDDLRESVDAAGEDRAAIREDVSALREDVADTDDRADEMARQLDEVADTASDAAAGVDELRARMDATEERLDDTEGRVDELEADLTDAVADVDDLSAETSDLSAEIDDVAAEVGQTADQIARLDEEMGDVREDIATLDGDVRDTRESLEAELDDLRADVSALSAELERFESIETDIEELKEFRDRLSDAFGPAGGGA